jgi:hypothetical protein
VNEKVSAEFIAAFFMVEVSKHGKMAGHKSVEDMGEEKSQGERQ